MELPENFREFSQAELQQAVFDDVVGFISQQHADKAVEWCSRSNIDKPDEDKTAILIWRHHQEWSRITKQPKFELTVLD